MVIAAGLGPFAGTLALALHTTGVLGRLYAESLENVPPAPERALREGGSGRIAAFAYATLPLVTAQGVAYALYRLEMNIRMAAVLGFVGAGGLGQLLYFHLSIFQQAQASTLLIAMFVLVFAVDSLSAFVRGRLCRRKLERARPLRALTASGLRAGARRIARLEPGLHAAVERDRALEAHRRAASPRRASRSGRTRSR